MSSTVNKGAENAEARKQELVESLLKAKQEGKTEEQWMEENKDKKMTDEETKGIIAAAIAAIGAVIVEVVKGRRQGITSKTIASLKEQVKKIAEDELLTKEEVEQLNELIKKVRENWIEKNM